MERCYGNGQGRGGGGGAAEARGSTRAWMLGITRQAEALSGWPFPRRTCACPSPSELWGAVERPTSAAHTHVRAAQPAAHRGISPDLPFAFTSSRV